MFTHADYPMLAEVGLNFFTSSHTQTVGVTSEIFHSSTEKNFDVGKSAVNCGNLTKSGIPGRKQ